MRSSTALARAAIWCSACAIAAWFAGARTQGAESSAVLRWTMLNVCGPIGQADCHLLTLPDGRHVLIDAADAGDGATAAVNHLRALGVREIALVVISHFHHDHYGRLLSIVEDGVKVGRVVVSIPGHRRIADREMPWGCNYDDVMATLARLTERGIPYAVPAAGEHLLEFTAPDGTSGELEVICAYDGISTPIGETDINDTSIILRVRFGNTRALFTGDLNHSLGAYLARSGADISADLLKAPHHGTEGVAPNEFFDRVGASTVLVPSPKTLWFSERSRRVREYFEIVAAPAFVSGIHGNVIVSFAADGYRIEHQNGTQNPAGAAAPTIVVPPKTAVVRRGGDLTLAVAAVGDPELSYQWRKDDIAIADSNAPALTLANVQDTDAGEYRVLVQNAAGVTLSAPARLLVEPLAADAPTARFLNLSTRAWVGHGEAQAILGFTIGGSGAKRVLVRAVGPTLRAFGVRGVLSAPRLALTTLAGSLIAANDDWDAGTTADAAALADTFKSCGAFTLPAGSGDAALIAWLSHGSYTVLIDSAEGATGIALGEVYDLEPNAPAHLLNLSGRALVREGDGALIAGYVVAGEHPAGVLVRGIGPSLRRLGVTLPLTRPRLNVQRSDLLPIAPAASWSRAIDADALGWAFARTGAFALEPGTADAATLLYHSGGAYTATIQVDPETSGIALVELYALP